MGDKVDVFIFKREKDKVMPGDSQKSILIKAFLGSSNLLFTIILGYRRLSVKFLYFLVSTG